MATQTAAQKAAAKKAAQERKVTRDAKRNGGAGPLTAAQKAANKTPDQESTTPAREGTTPAQESTPPDREAAKARKVVRDGKRNGGKGPLTQGEKDEKARTEAENAAAGKTFGADNMNAGDWVIDKFIPPGSLGRISTGLMMQKDPKTGEDVPVTDAQGNPTRIGENQDVLNRYKDLSKGMSAEQYQAAREQQQRGLNSGLATTQAQLAKAQARGKVYGAAGAVQQANALRADSEKRADLEQQNKLADVKLIREGTDKYAGALAGLQTSERGGQEYNLGQVAAEKAGQMGAYFNTIGIGQGNKFTQQQLDLQKEALRGVSNTRRGGGGGSTTPAAQEPEVQSATGTTNISTTNQGTQGNVSTGTAQNLANGGGSYTGRTAQQRVATRLARRGR